VETPTHSPLVSVILATFNYPSVLRYAIRSVLWQTCTDYELLVIGDACTDNTADVVQSFGDPRIRWHNLPENSGNQAGPNNAGLRLASGEFIAYMHQDDLWLPNHLQVLTDALQGSTVPLAHTLLLRLSPGANTAETVRAVRGLPGHGQFGPDRVSIEAPSAMHRADAARQIGGWRDWRTIHSTPVLDFFERLIGPEQRFISVQEVTVLKFHSGERRNSYIEQPSHEQAAFIERIQTEPDFLYRELLKALEAQARGWQPIKLVAKNPPAGAAPGWYVNELRRLRGLPTDAAIDASVKPPSVAKRTLRGLRALIPARVRRAIGRVLLRAGGFLSQ
jgi:glycosyltransferase involved in cell wall biosynthesis